MVKLQEEKRYHVTLSQEDAMQIEVIVLDCDEQAAMLFLKEIILPEIARQQQRPEAASLRHELDASPKMVQAATCSHWPRIDYRAQAVQYFAPNPEDFSTLFDKMLPSLPTPQSPVEHALADWGVGLHLSWQLATGSLELAEIGK
jgi:hypothetical protein